MLHANFDGTVIGLTLVVAGDSFFKTLFVVIIFHQIFEGLALGTAIASLPSPASTSSHPVRLRQKILMAAAFTLITPIGMAIGIGVLNTFNGNDPSTIIAIATLDAFSAGILLWVGLVELWAHEWMHGGLATAPLGRVLVGGSSLVTGMALMSLLGKWA